MEDMNLLRASGRACGTGSMDAESSHHPSNTILDGIIRLLDENDDDYNMTL